MEFVALLDLPTEHSHDCQFLLVNSNEFRHEKQRHFVRGAAQNRLLQRMRLSFADQMLDSEGF